MRELPYERQAFTSNGSVASGTFWIKVPTISASGDSLYVFYGRSDAADGQNPKLTWSDYHSVDHLNDATASSDAIGNMRTINGAPTNVAGKIGQASHFTSAGQDYFEVPAPLGRWSHWRD